MSYFIVELRHSQNHNAIPKNYNDVRINRLSSPSPISNIKKNAVDIVFLVLQKSSLIKNPNKLTNTIKLINTEMILNTIFINNPQS